MTTKLHRFLAGGWNELTASELKVYYDGAWHTPCDGPKGVWHFENGIWQKFPCGEVDVFATFAGWGDDISFQQQVYVLRTAGVDAFAGYSDNVMPLTRPNTAQSNMHNWVQKQLARDYSKVYASRTIGNESITYNALEMSGSVGDVQFVVSFGFSDWSTPVFFEFEFGWDSGLLASLYSSYLGADIVVGQFGSTRLYISDVGATGAYNCWRDDQNYSSVLMGHLEDEQWHTVRWSVPASGNRVLEVDGDTDAATPSDSGYFTSVHSVNYGLIKGILSAGFYIGAIKVGSSAWNHEHIFYRPAFDGLFWQEFTDVGTTYGYGPDNIPKGYEVNQDGIADMSWVETFTAREDPPSGAPALKYQVWELSQDGFDKTDSDYAGGPLSPLVDLDYDYSGASMPLAGYVERGGGLDSVFQVTDAGLLIARHYVEDQVLVGPSFKNIFHLHIYNVAGTSVTDILNGADVGDTYGDFVSCGFSPSGEKFAFMWNGPHIINIDSTGLTAITVPTGTGAEELLYWTPADETVLFWKYSTGTFATNRDTIASCPVGGSPTDIAHLDYGIFNNLKISPDGLKILFIGCANSDNSDINVFDVYTVNIDGTDFTKHTTDFGFIRDVAWSPDGTKVLIMGLEEPLEIQPAFTHLDLSTDTLTPISLLIGDSNWAQFSDILSWHHGWLLYY